MGEREGERDRDRDRDGASKSMQGRDLDFFIINWRERERKGGG